MFDITILHDFGTSLGDWIGEFDASTLTAHEAESVLSTVAHLSRRLGAVESMVAHRLSELGSWEAAGERSAAHQVARTTGTSVGEAQRRLDTGRHLKDLPSVADAARAGDLSLPQLALISDAAGHDPASQDRLVGCATSGASMAELREECARVKATATDPEERRETVHRNRYLRSFTDTDGGWNLRVRNTPEAGAEIMSVISSIADRRFRAAHRMEEGEGPGAHAADALVEIARGFGRDPARSGDEPRHDVDRKVIVRVDLEALLRGYPVGEESCEIAGFGPIAVSAVTDMIDTGNPFLAAVATRGETVVGVAHLGRRARSLQMTALQWLYPSCAVAGCPSQAHLEVDHAVDWAKTRFTVFDLLDRLCSHHHRLKTTDGWALVAGRGKRAFVPPGDPRHPRGSQGTPSRARFSSRPPGSPGSVPEDELRASA